MRQKSDAQQFLAKVELIDAIIEGKLIEQRQWKELALGITANMGGEVVQSSGSKSKMADALNKCIDMEAEIDRAVDRLVDTKRTVTKVLEQLESPDEYRLLHQRYIQFVELKDIAVMRNKDYTTITTAHGRALKNVQAILDREYDSGEAGRVILEFQRKCEEIAEANKK